MDAFATAALKVRRKGGAAVTGAAGHLYHGPNFSMLDAQASMPHSHWFIIDTQKSLWVRRGKRLWDICVMFFIAYNVLMIPMELAFLPSPESGSFRVVFDYLGDTFFILDILVSFRSIKFYEHKGEEHVIRDPGSIARTYLLVSVQ